MKTWMKAVVVGLGGKDEYQRRFGDLTDGTWWLINEEDEVEG